MFILQVIKHLEINGAKRVIRSKSAQNLEQSAELPDSLLAARNILLFFQHSDNSLTHLLRPATKSLAAHNELFFLLTKLVTALIAAPATKLLAARNEAVTECELVIFKNLDWALRGI